MFPKPTVYNQAEATQKEMAQQMKQVLMAASAIEALTSKVSSLESTLLSFETKLSNISKVLKLQQDFSERRDSALQPLQEKLTSLDKTERVVADLAYRISSLESALKSQSAESGLKSKVEDRVAALEERVSRLTAKQANGAGEGNNETERRVIASLNAAASREELYANKVKAAVEGLQRQIDAIRGTKGPNSPPKKVAERLRYIEEELTKKAELSEVQKLSDVLEREIRSREVSLMDSWRKDDPPSSKSLEARLNQLESQISTYERPPPIIEVSKHLGTGCGSFGLELKENLIPPQCKRSESAKPRGKSQVVKKGKRLRSK